MFSQSPNKKVRDPGNANTRVQMQVYAPPSAVWEVEVIHWSLYL